MNCRAIGGNPHKPFLARKWFPTAGRCNESKEPMHICKYIFEEILFTICSPYCFRFYYYCFRVYYYCLLGITFSSHTCFDMPLSLLTDTNFTTCHYGIIMALYVQEYKLPGVLEAPLTSAESISRITWLNGFLKGHFDPYQS